ncbi:MAG: lytic transglycosylase domain-containing protein [Bdellovibrionales bacterium]|nr:lytic transglycosylase domain-containing protein [Bdellovibrionales bacterium]
MSKSKMPIQILEKTLKGIAFVSGTLAIVFAALNAHQSPLLSSEGSKEEAPSATAVPIALSVAPAPAPSYHIVPLFDRERVLSDMSRRIPDDFLIPPGLQQRVGFWFDIYSRYDSHKRVIHHVLYPWVVYKVVDVEPIINTDFPKFRWQRNQVADKLVKDEMQKVRVALKRLAAKKKSQLDDEHLSSDEIQVRDALLSLGGDVRRRAKEALREVRVQTGQRNFFAEGLQTAPRYLPTMEEIFKKHKLPIELTRLPLVESSFNKHAKSKVGAAGIWQFMESTGRSQKLIVNNMIDERKSPFKATDAAARLLKENHMILSRSWELAITAWNHGPGGIKKASRAVGSKDLARIIEVYHSRTLISLQRTSLANSSLLYTRSAIPTSSSQDSLAKRP